MINKTKIAYISGPISGLDNGNFDAFQNAQRKLESEGYIVENPHEIGADIYKKWSIIPFEQLTKEQIKEMWIEFMKKDLKHLLICNCVFVLSNWESSAGSTLELVVAQKLNMPIYYMKDYSDFNVTFQISKFDRLSV